MPDLLELVLNLVLELLSLGLEDWDYWRFYVPFVGSLAICGLVEWLVSNDSARTVLSAPVLLAGIVAGIVWEWRSRG